MFKVIFLFLFLICVETCKYRKVDFGYVCVCNATNCDTVPKLGPISNESIKIYFTSNDQPGFNVKEQKFTNTKSSLLNMIVDLSRTYQKIIGFGGAFTDSTGHNINLLPEGARKKLMESYFSDDGLEYNLGRVTIGGADFSPNWYTFDDRAEEDMDLKYFALSEEDFKHKIPFIKQALSLRKGKQLNLFGSAWVIPHWMLYPPRYTIVKDTHYQVYANYYKKYFDEYEKNGVKFWGLTTGNEPANAFATYIPIQAVAWVPLLQAKWIRENLGPTLRNSSHKNLKIIFHDDSLESFPFTVPQVLNDGKTLEFLDGVATHWYYDSRAPLEIVDLAQTPKKDFFLLHSEACIFKTKPFLGYWNRARMYMTRLIDHIEAGYNGWIDWNLAVNSSGGPNNLNWNADAPIIISKDATEFYKQPFFYAIGHFSKFVVPGSIRINVFFKTSHPYLRAVGFLRPDNIVAVILHNMNTAVGTKIQLTVGNKFSEVEVPASSFQTILFSK